MIRGPLWSKGSRGRGQIGASAVEFALVVPLVLTLFFAIFEFGRFIWLYQAVSAASREATRYAIGVGDPAGTPPYLDCAGIRQMARDRAPDLELADGDIVVTYQPDDNSCGSAGGGIDDGDRVAVQVTTEMDLNLPFINLGGVTVSARNERSVYPGDGP